MFRTMQVVKKISLSTTLCKQCRILKGPIYPVLSPDSYYNGSPWKYTQRFGSSKRPPLVFADIKDADTARALVLQLKPQGRALVMSEIQKMTESNEADKQTETDLEPGHIKNLWLYNALPFVGFGFLDNFIMIVAGEYIDIKLGAVFTISTMAAAALGNLVSDVAGMGLSGYVEVLVGKIGITVPRLTPAQASSWQVRWTQTMGRVLGISIGCLLGMFPLLFYKTHHEHKDKETTESAQ